MEQPLLNEIQYLSTLMAQLSEIQNVDSQIFTNPGFRDATNWKHVASILATMFCDAMATSNPGVSFGNSNSGPVARFVSAILPQVTGDSVAPETVSAFLKELKRQEGKSTPLLNPGKSAS